MRRAPPVAKTVTYEFEAFPATYRPEYRWNKVPGSYRCRGWELGILSVFTYSTLKDARRQVDRLRRVYQMTGRKHLLKDDRYLKIERVERAAL